MRTTSPSNSYSGPIELRDTPAACKRPACSPSSCSPGGRPRTAATRPARGTPARCWCWPRSRRCVRPGRTGRCHSGAVGARRARRLHRLELLLDRMGGRARRRLGRREPDAALPDRVRPVRRRCRGRRERRRWAWARSRWPRRASGRWEIARALAGDAQAVFFDGRLAAPIGYENASAALFLAAFWAALLIAARRQTPAIARGVLLAAAGLLLQLTILAQSRGSLIAGAVTLAVAVALVRDRAPLLLALAAVALAAAASLPALLSVYDGGAPGGEPDLAPVGGRHVPLGRGAVRRRPRPRGRHTMGGRARARVAHARAGGGRRAGGRYGRRARAAAPGRAARPPTRASRPVPVRAATTSGGWPRWSSRATRSVASAPTTSRTTTSGIGTAARSRCTPTASCSRAVAQTGVVGGALLALFFGAVVMSVRSAGEDVAVAALVVGAVWVSHGAIDWLWEIPAVGAPAMAALGLAAGMGSRSAAGPTRAPIAYAALWPARRRCPTRCRRCRRGRSTAPCAAGAATRPRRCAASSAHERSTRCPTGPTSSPACWPAAPATTSGRGRRS